MDDDLVLWAQRFRALIEQHHTFARSIDLFTKRLIDHILSSSSAPPSIVKQPVAYAPTKAQFQADLKAFADAVFRNISQPPPPRPLASITSADLEKALKAQTTALSRIIKETDHTVNGIENDVKWVRSEALQMHKEVLHVLNGGQLE